MITYQVHVTTTAKGCAQEPQFEHLAEVLAVSPTEARLIACQMAGCRADLMVLITTERNGKEADHLMPLTAEIITDSTLDLF